MPTLTPSAERVLVVADWALDPHAVVAALARRESERHTTWSIVVPAWLHGLDWAGDPHASCQCAETALLTLRELALDAGLDVDLTVVGDPHPITAVADTCAAVRCDSILLCTRHRRLMPTHPLDLAHRMHGACGLPVVREQLATVGSGHCVAASLDDPGRRTNVAW